MTKTVKYSLIATLAVIIIITSVVIWATSALLRPCFSLNETAYIYVRPTTSEADICQQLQTEAQARTVIGWKMASRLTGFTPRTGRYAVEPGDAMLNVFRRIKNGIQTPVRFTIPSVWTLDRLAGVMAGKLMLDSTEVAEALRDSAYVAQWNYSTATLPALFIPNTYELYWDVSLEAFMQRMIRENETFWKQEQRNELAARLEMTHEEVVTLASIVDSETANNGEKPRVAGLYLNRLKQHIPLQADPTVKFAVGDFGLRRIRGEHLRIESPYNTYRHEGLPPGPIRIASIAGIDAVLHHENHTYLYMCAKEDFSGTHNFASNYAQHKANARRYQQALNARGIR